MRLLNHIGIYIILTLIFMIIWTYGYIKGQLEIKDIPINFLFITFIWILFEAFYWIFKIFF
jgi:type II secretory pathway component PulC